MNRGIKEELRYWEGEYNYPSGLLASAANRIDQLEKVLAEVLDAIEVEREQKHYDSVITDCYSNAKRALTL